MIHGFLRWALPVTAAVGLLVGLSTLTARAAEEKKGSIKGSVVDKDGKAVEGATVRLSKPRERGAGGGGQAQRPQPLATATTDKDGKFDLTFETKAVPDGEYRVSGGVRGQGGQGGGQMGVATVTVKDSKAVDKDGKATDVKIKLGEGGGRRGGGAGGGQ